MSTGPQSSIQPRWAKTPFYFNSSAHLLRISRQKAATLEELLQAIRDCPDACIFQHMFQTLEEHHFIREGFSNDFAHWAFYACNEIGLAERLAALDVREFTAISAMRERIIEILAAYLKDNPKAGQRAAAEPFYLISADLVVVPTPYVARNLDEFLNGLRKVSVHSIYYHFIDARLRLKLNNNDFSVWLEEELGLGRAAERLNRIDIYTSTLEGVRRSIERNIEIEAGRA